MRRTPLLVPAGARHSSLSPPSVTAPRPPARPRPTLHLASFDWAPAGATPASPTAPPRLPLAHADHAPPRPPRRPRGRGPAPGDRRCGPGAGWRGRERREGPRPKQNCRPLPTHPPPASQAVPGDARTLLVTCPIASRTEVRPLSAKSLRPLSAALPPVDDASFIAWAYAVPPAPDAAACAGVEAVPFGVGEGGERVGRGGQAFFGAPRARARRRPRRPLPFSLVPFSSGDTLAIPGSSGASLTRTADAVNVTMAGAAGAVPLPAGAKSPRARGRRSTLLSPPRRRATNPCSSCSTRTRGAWRPTR